MVPVAAALAWLIGRYAPKLFLGRWRNWFVAVISVPLSVAFSVAMGIGLMLLVPEGPGFGGLFAMVLAVSFAASILPAIWSAIVHARKKVGAKALTFEARQW
ncbi:MAG: hypothetical protein ACK4MS_13260 [Paracoccaceae bacterium]